MRKDAQQLKVLYIKLYRALGIFEFYVVNDWLFINNNIYPVINKLSDEEKKEFACDFRDIEWLPFL